MDQPNEQTSTSTDGPTEAKTFDYDAIVDEATAEESTESKDVADLKDQDKDQSDDVEADTEQVDAEEEDEEVKEESEEDPESDEQSETKSEDDKKYELIHDGEPKELSLKEMKEYAQKGFDYTQKTQAFSEEKKSFQLELDRTVQQLEQRANEYQQKDNIIQQWELYLGTLKEQAPDFYNQVLNGFQFVSAQYNNPVIKSQLSQVEQMYNELKQRDQQRELDSIRTTYQNELKNVQAQYEPQIKALKLKVDWKRVEDRWKNSNDLDVERAFIAEYGSDLVKRVQSKAKVATTKKRVESSKTSPTAGALNKAKSPGRPSVDYKGMDYYQIADEIMREFSP